MSLVFPVSPEKQNFLKNKMETLGIKESDLEESFTKSGGNGGQNVNKVATAVHLKHKPSGIEVKCSVYRTQGLNRYKARAILCEKLESTQGKGTIERKKEKIIKNKQKKIKRQRDKLKERIELNEEI
jgi:peptide chain release factor